MERRHGSYPGTPRRRISWRCGEETWRKCSICFYNFWKVLGASYAKVFSLSLAWMNWSNQPWDFGFKSKALSTISRLFVGWWRKTGHLRYNGPSDYTVLKAHVKDYLCDQSCLGFYYHVDRKPHHISIARCGLSLMFESPWSVMNKYVKITSFLRIMNLRLTPFCSFANDVKGYFHEHLHEHLYDSNIDPLDDLSSDNPVMDLIEDPNRYTYHGGDHWNTPYL